MRREDTLTPDSTISAAIYNFFFFFLFVGAFGSEQFLIKMMVIDALISQGTLVELMEQVGSLFQLVDASRKQKSIPVVVRKELTKCMHAVLRHITMDMISFSILPRHHQVTWPGRWKCEKEGTYEGIFVHRIS
jgi:hypothetical protein